jgi:hypothetical protein
MTGSIDGLWHQLGIAPTVDESTIRRAYAKRLRQVRPDDDPAGFQRLVEARDRALQLAQQRAGGNAARWRLPEDGDAEPSPPPAVEPAAPPLPPPVRPVAPPSPPPVRPATPPPVRTVAPPSPPAARPVAPAENRPADERTAVLDLLDNELRMLSDDAPAASQARRADWRPIIDRIARLSMADRAAIQPDLIRRLSACRIKRPASPYWPASNKRPRDLSLPFADWPPEYWPFFDLVAQLAAEFGWREQDRIVHLCLPTGEADRFILLLAWAHAVADAGPDGLTPLEDMPRVREIDVQAFYDGGWDLDGLRAFRAMRDNPSLWRTSDAATDLFFPIWSLRDGRYLAAALGLAGWASLIVANGSWRSTGFDAMFPGIPAKAVLLDAWCAILAIWILLGTITWKSTRGGTGALRARRATVFFPLWAFARGLYVRGVIGILAWGAVFASVSAGLRLGPVLLAVVLHGMAGRYGQRWVAYKLLRTARAADRAGLGDAAERFRYVRRRRTAEPRILQWTGGRFSRWLAIIAVLTFIQALSRLLQALH